MDSDATEEQGSTEDEDTPDEDEEDEEEYIGGDFNEDVSYIYTFYSVYGSRFEFWMAVYNYYMILIYQNYQGSNQKLRLPLV